MILVVEVIAPSPLPGRPCLPKAHTMRAEEGAWRGALTGQGGGTDWQRGGQVLVSLRLLRLRRPGLGVVGHLRLQGHGWAPGLVRAAGVLLFLGLQRRPDPLPPPLDQGHTVTDGLGYNFHVTLVEESRLNLQREPPPGYWGQGPPPSAPLPPVCGVCTPGPLLCPSISLDGTLHQSKDILGK